MPWCLTAVFRRNRRGLFLAGIGVASAATLLSGCRGIPARGETEARQRVAEVSRDYRPDGKKPPLPELTTNSTLADFLRYSLLNQPKVAAAYFDWVASGRTHHGAALAARPAGYVPGGHRGCGNVPSCPAS